MALDQHLNLEIRFRQQVDNAREYLLPFLQPWMQTGSGLRVMEIGCGEGGVLRAFAEQGAWCLGVDLSESRIRTAQALMAEEIAAGQAEFIAQNVYDPAFEARWAGQFDWIVLKDTIEHIPEQERFIPYLVRFLKPGGKVFFGFPPWYMPFGGHQQICRSRLGSKLVWMHLLPRGAYARLLRALGEPEQIVSDLLEIQDTGLTIARFERILRRSGHVILARTLFLINPIYRYKFGLRPRRQLRLLAAVPPLRESLTTAAWYVVEPLQQAEGLPNITA
ncbi:MAG: class I SAM-dependent methyltransferase [Bacteroidia bacterium]|nr:class I SAM-dependent methyltransferase [Bacteroidia bacterium]